jgi:predicted nucleic acid-binding protein
VRAVTEGWRVPAEARGWYLDASALVKVYLSEAGSVELERALEGRDDLITSELAITETVAAWARRRRDEQLSSTQMASLSQSIFADVESGTFDLVDLSPNTHRAAERLLFTASTERLRAADALHLAQAFAAAARVIVTFDRRLSRAAESAGLFAIPSNV